MRPEWKWKALKLCCKDSSSNVLQLARYARLRPRSYCMSLCIQEYHTKAGVRSQLHDRR